MSGIYYEPCTLELCRDLAMRTHGKFSVGSENKFHRFAIEIMNYIDQSDIRVWELTHEGYGFDFRLDGTRLRTVVSFNELAEAVSVPKFAEVLPDFLKAVRNLGVFPTYIRMWCKLDFEGKIWNTPKVYVHDLILSSYSLNDICGDDVKEYIQGVFDYRNFKEFRRMKP